MYVGPPWLTYVTPCQLANELLHCLEMMSCRVARFFLTHCTKLEKTYQIATKLPNGNYICIQNDRNIFQMATEYTNLLHSKALKNIPKLGILVEKYTIWQL
jgi:hypothetical protein